MSILKEEYIISMLRYGRIKSGENWFTKCTFVAIPTKNHADLLQDFLNDKGLTPFEVEEDLNGIRSVSPSLIETSYSRENYKRINFDMRKDLDCDLIVLDDEGNQFTSGELHKYFEDIIYYPCPKSKCRPR